MSSLPPVWIVSLRRSQDRRAAIAENMHSLGVPFEFYDAIDGRNLSPEHEEQCDQQEAWRILGRHLTPSEIGANLSHFELYRKLVASDHDAAIILEDDTEFAPALRRFVEQALLLPRDWDVLHLHDGGTLYPPVFSVWGQRRIGEHVVLRPTTPLDLSHAYILGRRGAETLLQSGFPVRVPQDSLTSGAIEIGLRIRGVKPSIATQRSFASTLADAYAARAAMDAEAARSKRAPSTALRAVRFLRERAMRFYQRVSPFAKMKLVK